MSLIILLFPWQEFHDPLSPERLHCISVSEPLFEGEVMHMILYRGGRDVRLERAAEEDLPRTFSLGISREYQVANKEKGHLSRLSDYPSDR